MDTVIVEIRPAEGGDDAKLFTQDLLRVILKYCERKKWLTELVSIRYAKIGCGEIVLMVTGKGVYSLVKEAGGHRVQRVPPTEKRGRRQTSTVTIAVLPLPKSVNINILDKDLRWDTMRSSGPGGQNVNKNETAVRVTHIPTGICAIAQTKSQHLNKQKAFEVLTGRLFAIEQNKINSNRAELRSNQIGSGMRGDKIRTIRYQDGQVTDHRTGNCIDLKKWLDGDLDLLMT